MLRLRFFPGLIAGLMVGLPLGALLALTLVPPRGDMRADPREVERLTRRLEEADRDKLSLNRQLDEFRALADKMTASFAQLETRFRTLEESARGSENPSPAATPQTDTVTPVAPVAAKDSSPSPLGRE